MALTTTTGSGTQTTTGTPQTVGAPSTAAAKTGSVQPGTATSLLTSTQGVSLSNTPVTTVNLSGSSVSSTSAATQSTSSPNNSKHINPAAIGFCGILLLIAVMLFFVTSKSAKNTT